jgi:hypothetical protein
MKSGLIVSVYRNSHFSDSSNGGWSSVQCEALLVLPEGGPFKASEHGELPIIVLVDKKPYFYVTEDEVEVYETGGSPGMFGGNFVYHSDSRFPSRFPIPIHDRFEFERTHNESMERIAKRREHPHFQKTTEQAL